MFMYENWDVYVKWVGWLFVYWDVYGFVVVYLFFLNLNLETCFNLTNWLTHFKTTVVVSEIFGMFTCIYWERIQFDLCLFQCGEKLKAPRQTSRMFGKERERKWSWLDCCTPSTSNSAMKKLGWLNYIGDYTAQLSRNQNNPLWIPINQPA